jgi:uncharacterized protein YkwD
MDLRLALAAWLALVNVDRDAAGVPPLHWDPDLAWVAQWRSEDMATRGAFGHGLPDGGTVFDVLSTAGVPYKLAAENLGRCACEPEAIEQVLMGSTNHRENVLEEHFRRVGLGVARASDGRLYYVQLFAG